MLNIDADNITDAVLGSLAGCTDERLKTVLQSLVRHLHDCAREVRLTPAELLQAVEFLTDVGHTCTPQRQEFILLFDTLGLSMLTVALQPGQDAGTEATVLGPFHVEGAPHAEQGSDIAGDAPGKPMDVVVTVCSPDGTPVVDAEVDIWQADDDGFYDVQIAELEGRHRARAVMRTDGQGQLRFSTVVPTPYPVPTDGPVGRMLLATGRHPWRPAHLHFRIHAAGHHPLTTHLFRDDDAYLDSDVVFGVRQSLVVHFDGPDVGGRYRLTHRFVLSPVEVGE